MRALAISAGIAAAAYLAIGIVHARRWRGSWNLEPLLVLAWPAASRVRASK